MRMLGNKAPIAVFRWDLVYLAAQLLADDRPGVSALAPPVKDMLVKLDNERDALEDAEDQCIIAAALVNKKDRRRDGLLVELGGVARASDKEIYSTLFGKRNPSSVARLGIDDESKEIARVLAELVALDADHPIRVAYAQELTEAEAGVKAAVQQTDAAITALAIQRSQLSRCKVAIDEVRLATHGSLTTLLKDKAEVDSFFRGAITAPGDEAKTEGDASPPAAASPATPPSSGGAG